MNRTALRILKCKSKELKYSCEARSVAENDFLFKELSEFMEIVANLIEVLIGDDVETEEPTNEP